MGIKHLWDLLTPHCERKPLFVLHDKTVAVDLSGWICESLNVVDYSVHPRFYLRNLFFRTCYLLQVGIVPIFVLEGAAPPIKYDILVKRNHVQFRGARPRRTTSGASEQHRNRFQHVMKQCEELLGTMGLTCVQAPGEAEALCAYLNRENLVYGVVSQDSDCFAYGAVKVFRNFSATQRGGSVDIYDMERIRNVIDLGQPKIIAMGLLLGCDYCPGVSGVGPGAVQKLLARYDNNEILEKLRSWGKPSKRLINLEAIMREENTCADCGHRGKSAAHRRSGCPDCKTKTGCDKSKWANERLQIRAEMEIKRKSWLTPNFPSEAIIDEFMVRPRKLPPLDLGWKQPNMVKFIQKMRDLLQWNEIHCFRKLLPLFTRWQLVTLSQKSAGKLSVMLVPSYIKKKRFPKGVASYEIVWSDEAFLFAGLVRDGQIATFLGVSGNTMDTLWSTIEPKDLVELVYPTLVESFLASESKPKKKTTNDKKAQEISGSKQTSSLDQPTLWECMRADEFEDVDRTDCVNGSSAAATCSGRTDENDDLNMTLILERIANENPDDDSDSCLSDVIDRVCDPNYGKCSSGNDIVQPRFGVEELLAMSVRIDEMENIAESNANVERRLLLKKDINIHATDVCNISLLNGSHWLREESLFFEPLEVPPPELQDSFDEMDMFECSFMLKDQVVVPMSDRMNQTIVFDIDF
ncbi:flap endonuclease GEN-like [Toxorhynchites rutilus septentrionalis]|uniref:flap endonuclease GEN-like n=1 Tax=Toxorhynchites rutilus septentrionalis TaxID=329112 RepID=UPI00247A601B|nr:flap endonuclease GEN-like [Toxorhynchites rutilus septentrionalis]